MHPFQDMRISLLEPGMATLLLVGILACGGGGATVSPSAMTTPTPTPTTAPSGNLTISLSGLDANTSADITVTGPNGFQQNLTKGQTLSGLKAGSYVIQARRVSTGVINGITTGHDYDPRPLEQTLTLTANQSLSADPIAYSVASTLSTNLVVNPGVSDIWSYIAYPLPSTTYAWSLSGGTIQSSRTDAYGLKWTSPSTLPASGTVDVSCTTLDTFGVSQTFTQKVWVVPPFDPAPAAIYGLGVGGDTLSNLIVGGPNANQVDFRFKASHSGALEGFRKTLKWNSAIRSGYSAGTGGTLRFALYADDGTSNHSPTGSPLATVDYGDAIGDATPYYPHLSFNTQPTLVAGTYYHLVVSNIDAAPSTNYRSTNEIATLASLSPAQPTFADGEWGVATGSPGSWTLRANYLPSLELTFADGFVQGKGLIGAWNHACQPISGSKGVREVFTVGGATRSVDAAYVRLRRVSGSSPLTILLQDANTTIDSIQIPASSIPTAHHWTGGAFSTPRTLAVGTTYYLSLQCPSDSTYEAFPLQDGSEASGFDARTAFSDGHAEYNPGSGWIGWTPYTATQQTDGDLQFYFRVVP